MTNPRQLYEITSDLTQIPLGLPVLGCLTGFTDAGGTVSQITDSIFASLDTRLLIEFKNDELLDFRSRRPVMFFERDHIISYEPPILGLYLVHDDAGVPFLMLHGYEPDFKWDSFAASVEEIFDLLSVSSFTWVHSIPFPLPHTRPVGITVSGNRQSLIEEHSEWKPSTQVPGNVMHLLEYQLSKSGLPFVGFVLLIPHYLSDSDYPQAALTAFEKITAATGIIFKTDPLREELTRFLGKLNTQLGENQDLQRMVQNLESGFAGSELSLGQASLKRPAPRVPSADEIAAELEDFLASRRRRQDDSDDGQNQ